MASDRRILAPTRRSITHKFSIAGHEGYLTIGLFEDGTAGEVFIKIAKEGSTLSGLVQGFCRAFSLSLQYGLSVPEACARFRGMSFDPQGPTANPEIPTASSILDYVARYLELSHAKAVAHAAAGARDEASTAAAPFAVDRRQAGHLSGSPT